jgi:hypothetical protein
VFSNPLIQRLERISGKRRKRISTNFFDGEVIAPKEGLVADE